MTYDGSSKAGGLQLYLKGKPVPTKVLRDHIHKSAIATGMRTAESARSANDSAIAGSKTESSTSCTYTTGLSRRWRSRTCTTARRLAEALADAPADTSRRLRAFYFSAIDEPRAHTCRRTAQARKQFVDAEEAIQEVSVMEELPEPRPTYILTRGAYDTPKSEANRVTAIRSRRC